MQQSCPVLLLLQDGAQPCLASPQIVCLSLVSIINLEQAKRMVHILVSCVPCRLAITKLVSIAKESLITNHQLCGDGI